LFIKFIKINVILNNFVKNILVERNIAENKIVVLPHFIKNDNEIIKEIKSKKNYVLCMGRISKNKGIDNIINIFKDIKGCNLYLAGSIENDFKIVNHDNIKYLGHLNTQELNAYIKGAQFVVSGSKLPETFGLIALESVALGKPFVGFKSGAYEEIIKNGENGYLVKDNKELEKTIKEMISKKNIFDENKIKTDAIIQYDENVYRKKIESVFLQCKK